MSTLFVSPKKIAETTHLGGNIDSDKVVPHIVTAQDRHIHPVIGTKLFKHLKALIEDNTIGLPQNEKYKTLLDDFIVPALVHFTLVNFIPFHQVEIANAGIVSQNNENAFTASDKAIRETVQRSRDNGEFYLDRLSKHLCAEGQGTYPEFQTENSGDIYPKSSKPFHGINLGNTHYLTLKERGLI